MLRFFYKKWRPSKCTRVESTTSRSDSVLSPEAIRISFPSSEFEETSGTIPSEKKWVGKFLNFTRKTEDNDQEDSVEVGKFKMLEEPE